MTWTVQFTGLAEDDVDEAYAWYASSRRGLGEEFIADMDAVVQMLQQVKNEFFCDALHTGG